MTEEPTFRTTYWCVKHDRHMENSRWGDRCGFPFDSDEEHTCEPQLMVLLPIRDKWARS